MSEQKSIKETKEVLQGMKTLLISAKKIMADKKVNVADLPELMALAQKSSELVAAVEGVKEIPAELKELDAMEAQELVAEIYQLIKDVKAA